MVEIFKDAEGTLAHGAFQAWRALHPDSFFLNLKTKKKAMLHRVQCQHLQFEEDGSHSLTKRQKVCAADISSLSEWANRSSDLAPVGRTP